MAVAAIPLDIKIVFIFLLFIICKIKIREYIYSNSTLDTDFDIQPGIFRYGQLHG